MKNILATIPFLALALGCNVVQDAEHLEPRNLGVRPEVQGKQMMLYLGDVLKQCADGPAATDGPAVFFHYSEMLKPGPQQVWILEIRSMLGPSKNADCVRETLLKNGGSEIIPQDTTGGSSESTGG